MEHPLIVHHSQGVGASNKTFFEKCSNLYMICTKKNVIKLLNKLQFLQFFPTFLLKLEKIIKVHVQTCLLAKRAKKINFG